MDKIDKLSGGVKAVLTVALVLGLTGALVLLAAEKPAAEKGERAFLGVSVRGLDEGEREDLGLKFGVRVLSVEKESAAAKAGILEKDIILTVDGDKVRSPQALVEIVRDLAPGSAVKVALRRQGKPLEVKAVLGRAEVRKRFHWQSGPAAKVLRPAPYLGVSILDLDADLAAYFAVKPGEGVLVSGVEEGTPAAKAGFKSGDVIVQVAKNAVKNGGDVRRALAELKEGDEVEITVVRRGRREALKAVPDFKPQRRIFRIFRGGKHLDLGHLELPEIDMEIPDIDIDVDIPEPPEPPDAEAVAGRVRMDLERSRECLERAREKMGEARVRIVKKLREAGAGHTI